MMIEWSVSARTHPDEHRCGDAHVAIDDGHRKLFAVVDGLGHGAEAHAAASRLTATVAEHASDSLLRIFEACYAAARRTRGAAMTLARIDPYDEWIEWGGVGNVEGMLFGPGGQNRRRAPAAGGIVGYRLPRVRFGTTSFVPADTMILVTDGVRLAYEDEVLAGPLSPDGILDAYGSDRDDALVLIARHTGAT